MFKLLSLYYNIINITTIGSRLPIQSSLWRQDWPEVLSVPQQALWRLLQTVQGSWCLRCMQVQLQEDFFKTFPNQDRIKLLNWFNVWFLGVAASVPPTSTSAWRYCWLILPQKTPFREYNTTTRVKPMNFIQFKEFNKNLQFY